MRSPWERELGRKKQFDVFITGCEITQPFSSLDGRWSWSWKGRMIHSPDSHFSLECRCTLSSESWAHVKMDSEASAGLTPANTKRDSEIRQPKIERAQSHSLRTGVPRLSLYRYRTGIWKIRAGSKSWMLSAQTEVFTFVAINPLQIIFHSFSG